MISVCMASYNGERYIKEQIDSIIKQLGPNDELIISDDGSSDNTRKIIMDYNDDRIIFIENKGVHGFTHNFENALNHSKGEYIFLSDQDDIWMDNKVKKTIEALSEYDFVISDCITVDKNMNVIQKSRVESFNLKVGFIRHLIKSRFLGCCMAMNREVLDAALPFPNNDKLVEHDMASGSCYEIFNTYIIEEPLIKYRRHNLNASDGGFDKGYSLANKIYRRLYRILELKKVKKE